MHPDMHDTYHNQSVASETQQRREAETRLVILKQKTKYTR